MKWKFGFFFISVFLQNCRHQNIDTTFSDSMFTLKWIKIWKGKGRILDLFLTFDEISTRSNIDTSLSMKKKSTIVLRKIDLLFRDYIEGKSVTERNEYFLTISKIFFISCVSQISFSDWLNSYIYIYIVTLTQPQLGGNLILFCRKDHNFAFHESVRQWPGRPGFNPRSSHTKDSKNGTWCLLA